MKLWYSLALGEPSNYSVVSWCRNAFWLRVEEQKKSFSGVSAILPLFCRALKNKHNFYQMEAMRKSLKVWLLSIRTHQFNEAPRNLGVNSAPRCGVAQNSQCDGALGRYRFDASHKIINEKQAHGGRFFFGFKCKAESASSLLTCFFLSLQI